jgi:hypothetical protein
MRFSNWVRMPAGRRVSMSLGILVAAGISQTGAGTGTAAQPAKPAPASKVAQINPVLRSKVQAALGEAPPAPVTPAMLSAHNALNARINTIGAASLAMSASP